MWGDRLRFLAARQPRLALACLLVITTAADLHAADKPTSFELGNGMQVVVIPDRRAPVVTHMVWYRVGAADDPWGRSGLAHFLEHLMFKATDRIKSGEFTRIVNRLGGRHNALTNHDTTSYFQRVAKAHLASVMELEADRMLNLRLTEEEVRTERDVVKEERRSSVDAAPISMLNEQMLAQLYQNHPYGRPVLGWAHEIAELSLADAQAFYRRHYAPENSILVVAGDVIEADVRKLAERTYGRNPRGGPPVERRRPREPEAIAARSVRVEDERATTPLVLRYYDVPSRASEMSKDAPALAVLARILGGDDVSRLYRRLVAEEKIAVQSGADYQGGARDGGRLAVLALAGPRAAPEALAAAIDDVIATFARDGVTDDELRRAKLALEVDHVHETDHQEKRARSYAEAIANGRSPAAIDADPQRVAAVTADDVARVARAYLVPKRSVTGVLVKPEKAAAVSGEARK